MTKTPETPADPEGGWRRIREASLGHNGLDLLGVCTADPFPDVERELRRRVAEGLSGRLSLTFADPAVSADVRATFPWARRIVVAGRSYLPAAGDPGAPRPGTGRVARFATEDAYKPLRYELEAVRTLLREGGWQAEVLIDDNRLVDRAAAVRAGLGWWGKSSMVITNRLGPWTLLGSVVTDAEMPVTEPTTRTCGACVACVPACPTGAIVEPGVVDARRCLAALLQGRGDIPRELRPAVEDRVYGCDDCLEACPPGSRLLGQAAGDVGRIDLVDLLRMTDSEILARFGRFYLPGRKPGFLRRNALVALGNGGTAAHVGLLAGYLGDSEAMLRRHAAWALGRIGGEEAREVLRARLETEDDGTAREEIAVALAAGQADPRGA